MGSACFNSEANYYTNEFPFDFDRKIVFIGNSKKTKSLQLTRFFVF